MAANSRMLDEGDGIETVHDDVDDRYEAWLGGEVAGAIKTIPRDGRFVLGHPEFPAVEGGGVGPRVAKAALDDVRGRGLLVTPECRFVMGCITRHRKSRPRRRRWRPIARPQMRTQVHVV